MLAPTALLSPESAHAYQAQRADWSTELPSDQIERLDRQVLCWEILALFAKHPDVDFGAWAAAVGGAPWWAQCEKARLLQALNPAAESRRPRI